MEARAASPKVENTGDISRASHTDLAPHCPLSTNRFVHFVSNILYLSIALILFLALSLKNITLPGLYYDEALDVVPAMQILYDQPIEPVRKAAITIAGYTLPLMVMDYVGTVNTYLALPAFAMLGVNVISVRVLPITLAALSLILGYLVALRLFNQRVAAMTTLLVAMDPSFIFFSRMGIHVTSVMTVFSLGSLLAFLQWHRSGQRRWLLIGGVLLGLGLWAKVLFLWWIIALSVAWGVRWWAAHGFRIQTAQLIHGFGTLTRGQTALLLTGLLVGAAPLLAYNVMTGGTLIAFSRNVLVTEYGVNNLNVLGNLAAAVESFIILLDGRYFWFMGGQFANPVNVIWFALAVVGGAVLVWQRPAWRQNFALIALIIAVTVAESAFTVSGIWATHLYILFPLPQLIMAVFVVLLAEVMGRKRRWISSAVISLALAVGMLVNYRVDAAYHAAVERTGGLSRFSDAIYKLATWLDDQQFATVYAVDWGIQKNIQILTQGRVNPIEIYGFTGESADAFIERAEKALVDPSAVYLFHSKEDTVYELYPIFKATADRFGVRLKIIEAFRDRSGAPVYVVWARE